MPVRGDEERVLPIGGQLLENALVHTPPGRPFGRAPWTVAARC